MAKSSKANAADRQAVVAGTGKIISFALLLIIVVVVGALAYVVMRSFILPMFLAALLVVIFQPVDRRIHFRCKGRRWLSALLTTSVILLAVLMPIIWVITMGVTEAVKLAPTRPDRLAEATRKLDGFRERFGLQIPLKDELNDLQYAIETLTPPEEMSANFDVNSQAVAAAERKLAAMSQALDDAIQSSDTDQRERQRLKSARPRLDALSNSLSTVRSSMTDAAAEGAVPMQVALEGLSDGYRAFRLDMLGGFPWAPAIELANPSHDQIQAWQTRVAREARRWLLYLGGEAGGFIASFAMGLAVMVLSIYYFLVDGPEMIRTAMRLSPLDDEYESELLSEFSSVSRAVVLATLLSALAQGVLAGFAYWICDLHPLFLLVIVTTLLAMVPFVGAAAVWVPATIYLGFIAEDRMAAAIFMGIWGATVVSMADNLIKPLILHGQSKLHPLLALLSVIGGVQALGPIGLLVGPMVVSFLQALLNMLQKEISSFETN